MTNIEAIRILSAFIPSRISETDEAFIMAMEALSNNAKVKCGYWICKNSCYEVNECNCSLCGQLMTTHKSKRMNYCPNCGAKMERECEDE